MKEIKAELAERATEETILALIKAGILVIGDDNQIHCAE